ncbi:methylated-DNA--protein-cysteine methyltransferase [Spirochaetia bacterium]|nr:methylated-DNA--protein-cysteine methyltransferase [Spirochaetia bacterium]
MIYTCSIDTPLGPMTAAAEEEALTGLWFVGQKYYPAKADAWIGKPDQSVFAALRSWLEAYFEGKNPHVDFPLNPRGSAFQKSVWEILLQIPYGEVTTYGEIAKQLVRKQGIASMSAQAVGGAVGHNPVSLVIPCHRVVGADGSLTGYAGGLDKKKYLLGLEGNRI